MCFFENCIKNKNVEDHILEDRVEGVKKFKIEATPTLIINNKKFLQRLEDKQAAAAIGQIELANHWQQTLKKNKINSAQILLTLNDSEVRRHYLNVRKTINALHKKNIIPIINENDSVSVDELKRRLGENDMLAAYVTYLIKAELLVIMSDGEGLYTSFDADGPKGDLIREVKDGELELDTMVGENNSVVGRGGMQTKLQAAKLLMTCGEMTIIAHGR